MSVNLTKNAVNPFENLSASVETVSTRRLSYSASLIAKANDLAQKVIMGGTQHPELAQKVITDANTGDLLQLISETIGVETVKAEASILDGCSDDELAKLLESRRSDRSKAKKKGPASSMVVCKTYISAFIAELLVRQKLGKDYQSGSSHVVEYDPNELAKDQEKLVRKIKSLQSKQCRLKKLADVDKQAEAEYRQVQEEIARLNELRIGKPRVATTKVVIKANELTALRETLASIDPATLPEDEQEKFLNLMSKLG